MQDESAKDGPLPDHTILVRRSSAATIETRVHYLVVVQGHKPGQRIALSEIPIRIGRADPCELVLPDAGISRAHCRVENRFGEIVVIDLGSTNGTFIDGRPVEGSVKLPVDGTLQLGEQVLRHEFRSRKEVEEAQELDRDLEKAYRYVQSLLPAPWRTGPVTTEWLVLPSARLGGDALGFHALDARHYALYLVDVSGHGAGAAMHTVAVMNVLRHHAIPKADCMRPDQVLTGLNAMFDMDAHGGMYFTVWYGVFDTLERTLDFSSGGHHPAFLVPPDRSEAIPLQTRNVAVGTVPDYPFKSDRVTVIPGSTLYLFSDGVFEIVTADGEEWRLHHFVPLILQPTEAGVSEPERLHGLVQKISNREGFDDDFSMLTAVLH